MANYCVKEIPVIVVKYKKNEAKNYKKIVFDRVEKYAPHFEGIQSYIDFCIKMIDNDIMDDFKFALANDEIHDFILSAVNVRRSVDTEEDEKYRELKDVKFNHCELSYYLDGEPASFHFCFTNK